MLTLDLDRRAIASGLHHTTQENGYIIDVTFLENW